MQSEVLNWNTLYKQEVVKVAQFYLNCSFNEGRIVVRKADLPVTHAATSALSRKSHKGAFPRPPRAIPLEDLKACPS
jgi:hypothetical protein